MQRLAILAAALVSAALAAGMAFGTPLARAEAEVYEACRGGEERIVAAELPDTVDLDRCPVEGRVITDGVVGSVLPDPGEGVYVEVITTSGAQELGIFRSRDGTLDLDYVGDDSEAATADPALDAARRRGACSDPEYRNLQWKVSSNLDYRFNRSTTPNELKPDAAEGAIRKGGTNITSTKSDCRLGDRVPATLTYEGNTKALAGVDAGGRCTTSNDGESIVSFGKLTGDRLAVTCIRYVSGEVTSSDVKINKTGYNWTTRPGARSCKRNFDLEGVVTHEQGHTFGLGHVGESGHGALTMSTVINGPCQSAERTLGRGDVLGLANKYD